MPLVLTAGQSQIVVDEQRTKEPPERLFEASECQFVDSNLCKELSAKVLVAACSPTLEPGNLREAAAH